MMGGALGSTATIGSTVKPIARRSGATTSRALQMVGVSHLVRTSRSDSVNGRSAMIVSRGRCGGQSRPSAWGAQCAPRRSLGGIGAMTIARGGKAIYGAPLGILMLDARFPRIPGDMGNAGTWPFPVLYRVVRGASPERVVLDAASGLLDDFLRAAADLVADGAEAITTNCGFLSVFQRELA